MKLQMSLDRVDIPSAMDLIKEVYDVIDIIEIGTPLIATEGLHAVSAVRKAYAGSVILADTKIMDGGEYIPTKVFEAGADIVTVLAVAEDATIKKTIATAKRFGRQVLVDMIAVTNLAERVAQVDAWGADYIGVHVGVDIQGSGKSPLEELRKLTASIKNAKTAVAGGINLATLPDIAKENPGIVICGQSITGASSPRSTVIKMKEIINSIQDEGGAV